MFSIFSRTHFSPRSSPPAVLPLCCIARLALTPDASQLVVADFGYQNIYLLNPVTGTAQPCLSAEFPASQTQVLRAWPRQARKLCSSVSAGKVALPGACSTCLAQMNLTASPPTIQPAPQPEVTSITGGSTRSRHRRWRSRFCGLRRRSGGPVAVWTPVPRISSSLLSPMLSTDLGAASDGSMSPSSQRV